MSFYSLLHGISGVRRAVFRDAGGNLIEGMGAVSADTERVASAGKAVTQQLLRLGEALELGLCKMVAVRTEEVATALVLHAGSLAILDFDPKRLSPAVEVSLEARKWSAQPVDQAERASPPPVAATPAPSRSATPAPSRAATPAPSRPATTPPSALTPPPRPVSPVLRSSRTPTPVPIRLPRPPTKEVPIVAGADDSGAVVERELSHVDTIEMIAIDSQVVTPGPQKAASTRASVRAEEARPAVGAMPARSSKNRLSTTSELVAAAGDQTMFAGNLRMVSLPDLLEFCRNGRRTGVLFCRHGEDAGSVTVQLGRVLRAEAPKVSERSLLACLRERGAVTEEKLSALGLDSADQDVDDETVEKLLVGAGVAQETIQKAMVERIQSAIEEMLGWLDGTFAFHPTEEEKLTSEAAGFDPQHILLQIFKMKDEQSRDQDSE